MRKIALLINTGKSLSLETGYEILNWLIAHGFSTMLQPEAAQLLGKPELGVAEGPEWGTAELMIVLGGDGTLIRGVQKAAPFGIPVLGINTGHLGFLTALENSESFDHLSQILSGDFTVEERMMLQACVEREGQRLCEMTALNDAVISKGPRARMVHLEILVGETQVARYPADGVIVATPTGSTAYSLSAGGPIVEPTVDCLLVTPICPHTISTRAMVLGGNEEISIRVVESPGEVGLSADGSDPFPLYPGDLVRVRRAPYGARLVRRKSYRFYDVLREKLADR